MATLALAQNPAIATHPPQQKPSADTADADLASLTQDLQLASGSESASATTNDEGPAGIVPYTKGFNASLDLSGEHDSSSGWAEATTPDIAYRFDRHFTLNLSIPVYGSVNIPGAPVTNKPSKTAPATTTEPLVRRRFLLGDLTLDGGFEATSRFVDYALTVTLGMPTGDDKDGLGAGQFTYAVNNHLERQFFNWLTPEIEIGIDDSPNLDDARVPKDYTDVGANAHFQAGFGFDLPFRTNLTADAYEDLPLADQTITSTTTNGKKGSQLRTITTSSEKSIGEDNGFETTLDIPIGNHVTLSGFYDRSLREKTDQAGLSITFLLRGAPRGSDEAH